MELSMPSVENKQMEIATAAAACTEIRLAGIFIIDC